jgi:hypothetical protein
MQGSASENQVNRRLAGQGIDPGKATPEQRQKAADEIIAFRLAQGAAMSVPSPYSRPLGAPIG